MLRAKAGRGFGPHVLACGIALELLALGQRLRHQLHHQVDLVRLIIPDHLRILAAVGWLAIVRWRRGGRAADLDEADDVRVDADVLRHLHLHPHVVRHVVAPHPCQHPERAASAPRNTAAALPESGCWIAPRRLESVAFSAILKARFVLSTFIA